MTTGKAIPAGTRRANPPEQIFCHAVVCGTSGPGDAGTGQPGGGPKNSATGLEDWAGSSVEIDGRACHVG